MRRLLVLLLASVPMVRGEALRTGIGPGILDVQLQLPTAVQKLPPAELEAFRANFTKLVDVLRSSPVVAHPPADQCLRIYTTTQPVAEPVVEAAGTITIPLQRYGVCQKITAVGVQFYINRPSIVLPHNGVEGPHGTTLRDARGDIHLHPAETKSPSRFPRLHGFVVLGKPDRPLLLPVSRQEYLRALHGAWMEAYDKTASKRGEYVRAQNPEWLAAFDKQLNELRASAAKVKLELDSLNPEQARQTACMVPGRHWETAGSGDCPVRLQYTRLNPDYFDRSRPKSDIQLIVVENWLKSSNSEDPAHFKLRNRIFESLDYERLASLVK